MVLFRLNGEHEEDSMASVLLFYLAATALGVVFLPLCFIIFRRFEDGGWMFARTLGLFIAGYIVWTFNCMHLLPFRAPVIYGVVLALLVLNYGLYFFYQKKLKPAGQMQSALSGRSKRSVNVSGFFDLPDFRLRTLIIEEVIFFILFLISVRVICYNPEAYGTEKFMDYGFLTAMMRADYMPFEDMWFAGRGMNYYYGGQYLTVFLLKMSGTSAGDGYTIMRAFITACSFSLPFALVYQMLRDHLGKRKNIPWFGGSLAGIGVAFCGNMHYVIKCVLPGLAATITGKEQPSYWFPDATRFIGYDPDTHDKTIHEFPSYSSVLGDLHAHYINLIFALTITAVVYGWAQKREEQRRAEGGAPVRDRFFFARPEIILTALFTGVFRWTNFWDLAIYFVVCGLMITVVNFRTYMKDIKRFFIETAIEAVEVFALGTVFALPFTLNFDMISSKVDFVHSNTSFDQFMVLWGLPLVITISFMVYLAYSRIGQNKGKTFFAGLTDPSSAATLPDIMAAVFAFCAIGLIMLPEIVYVKDIYEGDYYRANTMFKLTYQAFILFGVCMGYMLVRFISIREKGAAPVVAPQQAKGRQKTAPVKGKKSNREKFTFRTIGIAGIVCLFLTLGYIDESVKAWFPGFGDDQTEPRGMDASLYLNMDDFKEDKGGIEWLIEHVEGTPVTVEAPGDSYTFYERVSVSTGLPTIAGWYVHEWLWQSGAKEEQEGAKRGEGSAGTIEMNRRTADVSTLYTSEDENAVREVIDKYKVVYIFVGRCEREKYGADQVAKGAFNSMGEVVYRDPAYETYIVRVGDAS